MQGDLESSRVSSNSVPSMPLRNRVHRRVIVCDYGKPIYKASTRAALLSALKGCIKDTNLCETPISFTENNLIITKDDQV